MPLVNNDTIDISLPHWDDHWPEDHPNAKLQGKKQKSVIRFRGEMTMADVDASAFVMARVLAAKARDGGPTPDDQLEALGKQQREDIANRSWMEAMNDGWEGPEFALPATYRDRSKPRQKDGKYPLHELAGQVPPCTLEWLMIGLRVKDLSEIILEYRKRAPARRSEDEQNSFPDGVVGVDKPEGAVVDAPSPGPRDRAARRRASKAEKSEQDHPDGSDAVD